MYNEASHCCKVFSVNQHIIAVGNTIKSQMLIMSDICLPAHAEGKISQCLSACLISIHLALWIICRRAFMASPVIQHLRNMADIILYSSGIGILFFFQHQTAHNTKHQIIILCAVILLTNLQLLNPGCLHNA